MKNIVDVTLARTGELLVPGGVTLRMTEGAIEVFPNLAAQAGTPEHIDNVFKRIVRALCAPYGEPRLVVPEFLQLEEGGECCTTMGKTEAAPPQVTEVATPPAAPSIGGVPIGAASIASEKKTRQRKPKADSPPPSAPAIAVGEPAPSAQSVATEPKSPFAQEMRQIDEAQRAKPTGALPEETVFVADPSPQGPVDRSQPVTFEPSDGVAVDQTPPVGTVDWFFDLFSEPPMPPDLSPLDARRSLSATEFIDTCYSRALFHRPIVLEQKGTSYEQLVGTMPEPQVVDMSTDEGVRAFVEMLYAVRERSVEMGTEIPQIEAFLLLGTKEQVVAQAIDTYRKRMAALYAQS